MELPAFIENTRTLLSVLTRYLDDYNPLSNLLGFWNVNTVNMANQDLNNITTMKSNKRLCEQQTD